MLLMRTMRATDAADVGIYRITATDVAGTTGSVSANVSAGAANGLNINLSR